MENRLPKRSEVKEEFTWNLKDIFESDEAFENALKDASSYPARLKEFEGRLGGSAGTLLEFLKLQDEISINLGMIYGYSNLKSDEDTGDSSGQIRKGKAMNLYVAIMGAMAFSTPEIIDIDEAALDSFYKEQPELEVYRRPLTKLRRAREHILSHRIGLRL